MDIKENIRVLLKLSKSKTARDSIVVISGKVLGAAAGFFATVLISRNLGPALFGAFSSVIAVMSIAAQFSDFGINTALVRFAAGYVDEDPDRARLMFKVAFKVKMLITSCVFFTVYASAGFIARNLFGNPELVLPLKISLVGIFGMSLSAMATAMLHSRRWFKKLTFLNLVDPIGRIIVVGALIMAAKLGLVSAIITLAVVPFLTFLAGCFLFPGDFVYAKGDQDESFRELLSFSKWVFASSLATMFIMRLDVLMIAKMSTMTETGYYASAHRLAMLFPLVTSTLSTVLFPKVSAYKTQDDYKVYIKKIKHIVPWVVLAFIVLLLLSRPMIILVFSTSYINSIPIFRVLLLSFMVSVIIAPVSLILYSLNKPYILTGLNFSQLGINFVGNYFLIPVMGALGASLSTLAVRLAAAIVIAVAVYINVYRDRGEPDSDNQTLTNN